ncbi:hypothetical protein R1sor_007421 [Riccia sorocarpa]|uniref:No apical meristem-associated C-terminal domain-containing protein n=1 Tax=Riccia sorocarpa TaxID=122646 RepID=A0ABD3HUL9_9MARC
MTPKKKDRPTKTPSKTTPKKTPPPSSSSNPSNEGTAAKVKMGPCKPIALPTTELKKFRPQIEDLGLGFLFWRWVYTAEPLVKESATMKSEVALPHRGKPHEWTVEHYRKMLGMSKEQEEPGGILRFNNALKTVSDGSPIYIDAFLAHLHLKNEWLTAEERSQYGEEDPHSKITADYSSSEDEDQPSAQTEKIEDGEQEVGKVVEDTGSDEDEDTDNTEEDEERKIQLPDFHSAPSLTSPNYSSEQIAVQQMKGKKHKVLRFEEPKTKKKTSKEDLEKKKAEAKEKEADLLMQIAEDGPS